MFCTCTTLEMRDTARKPSFVPDKKHARTEARDEVMQNPPTLDPEVTESLEYMITQSRNRTNVGAESTASRWLWECARESSVCSNTRLVESWRRRRWLCKERSMICVPTCTWVYSIRCTHVLPVLDEQQSRREHKNDHRNYQLEVLVILFVSEPTWITPRVF